MGYVIQVEFDNFSLVNERMSHRQNPSAVGEALKADLARLGISQAELARRMDEGLTQQAISKWIQHNKVPEDRLPKLSEVLGPNAEVVRLASKHGDVRDVAFTAALLRANQNMGMPIKAREEPVAPDLRNHTEEARLRELLPEELRRFMGVRLRVGGAGYEVDYLSPSLALELKIVTLPQNAVNIAARAALQLQVIREIAELEEGRYRHYTVALLMHQGLTGSVGRLAGDLALLGIEVFMTTSIEEVAEYIRLVETGTGGANVGALFD